MAGKRNLREPDALASIIPARQPVGDAGRDPLTGKVVPHTRSDRVAGQVEAMAALGFTVEDIAVALDLRPGQIKMYYERELAAAAVKANMQVAKAFFDAAKSGTNWQASLSWLRNRAGWKDGGVDVGGSGLSITINL